MGLQKYRLPRTSKRLVALGAALLGASIITNNVGNTDLGKVCVAIGLVLWCAAAVVWHFSRERSSESVEVGPHEQAPVSSGGGSAGFLTFALIAVVGWYFFGGGFDKQVQRDLENLHYQVADDVVQQFDIARRQGDPIQICVQAGLVSAAYLQAKDEDKYRKWKQVEADFCRAAGIR